jgi:hypothetical protein
MNRKNIYWPVVLIIIILSGVLPSCKKFTEIAPPKNQVLGADVFTDSLSINDAVLGIYTTLNSTALIMRCNCKTTRLLQLIVTATACGLPLIR